ncbi:hypothetical protein MTP99_008572 [Tenebrio molitor]|nr:hypothetical protein MTP99_008572 [Tenebrio molitor]
MKLTTVTFVLTVVITNSKAIRYPPPNINWYDAGYEELSRQPPIATKQRHLSDGFELPSVIERPIRMLNPTSLVKLNVGPVDKVTPRALPKFTRRPLPKFTLRPMPKLTLRPLPKLTLRPMQWLIQKVCCLVTKPGSAHDKTSFGNKTFDRCLTSSPGTTLYIV